MFVRDRLKLQIQCHSLNHSGPYFWFCMANFSPIAVPSLVVNENEMFVFAVPFSRILTVTEVLSSKIRYSACSNLNIIVDVAGFSDQKNVKQL